MDKLRLYISNLFLIISATLSFAYDNVRFHCDKDTTVINLLLKSPELIGMKKNDQVAFFAKQLVGAESNLRQEILEADTTLFTIDIHTFNPLSLISTCIALTQAYETSSAPNWRDFAEKYESIMYKGGKAGDFVSRFLYPSDWIADNIFRSNIYDATQRFEGMNIRKKERSIDYISHNKDSFKAFSNPENLQRIKMLEMGFRNHQIMYVSNGDLTNATRYKKTAENGDIIFLIATDLDLDSREMGVIIKEGNDLLFIHMSPTEEKVIIDPLTFDAYVKRNVKRIQGARVIRIE